MDFEVAVSNMFIDDTTSSKGDPKRDPKGDPKGDPKRFMVQKRKTIMGWGNTTYVVHMYVLMNSLSNIPCY